MGASRVSRVTKAVSSRQLLGGERPDRSCGGLLPRLERLGGSAGAGESASDTCARPAKLHTHAKFLLEGTSLAAQVRQVRQHPSGHAQPNADILAFVADANLGVLHQLHSALVQAGRDA